MDQDSQTLAVTPEPPQASPLAGVSHAHHPTPSMRSTTPTPCSPQRRRSSLTSTLLPSDRAHHRQHLPQPTQAHHHRSRDAPPPTPHPPTLAHHQPQAMHTHQPPPIKLRLWPGASCAAEPLRERADCARWPPTPGKDRVSMANSIPFALTLPTTSAGGQGR